jgi:hypothetical protein
VSVGFITHAFEMREMEFDGSTQRVRVFTDVELIEISAVAIPANRESLIRSGRESYPRGDGHAYRVRPSRLPYSAAVFHFNRASTTILTRAEVA